jgi:hypothetical protein
LVCNDSTLGSLVDFDAVDVDDAVTLGRGGAAAVFCLPSCTEDDTELEMLGLRTGARRVEVGATDCRFATIEALGVGFGATTLEGRAFGTGAVALGLVGAAAAVGFVEGLGVGCETMRTMFASLMKSPWPAGQVKYRIPRTDPSFFPVGVGSSSPSQSPSAT